MTEQNASKASRWEIMARERNARVIMCNTPDTYCLTDLARHADRSVRALRNRLLITLTPEQVLPLLEEYKDIVLSLHEVIQKMCETAGLDYTVPRSVKRLLGGDGKENKDGSEPH
ncbi:MAG: hypothetical protein ABIF87_12790 [Pseudomonadota bacterium]